MATIINHNMEAMNAYRNLYGTNHMLAKSLERLSSGYRINRASDDAAGLAISEKMRGQISGLNSAIKNALDGVSLIRVAEGALAEVNADLVRMRELAVLAATDILTSSDRLAYQNEFLALQKHVDRIANTTEFNTRTLLNGALSCSTAMNAANYVDRHKAVATDAAFDLSARHMVIQVGANVGQQISFGIINLRIGSWHADNMDFGGTGQAIISARTMNTDNLVATAGFNPTGFDSWREDYIGGLNIGYSDRGFVSFAAGVLGGWATVGSQYSTAVQVYTQGPVDITTISRATTALWRIDQAIEKVAAVRARLGAQENALNSAVNSLQISVENTQAAESRIRDADMALEMSTFTRNQVLAQAGMAMLAQANMQPQNVLSLLR
jgi:flagellin